MLEWPNDEESLAARGSSGLLLSLQAGLTGTGCYELSTPDGSPNDAIVALLSQRSGPGASAHATNYPELIHFGVNVDPPLLPPQTVVASVTNSVEVATRVRHLLDGPKAPQFAALPTISSDGQGDPITTEPAHPDQVSAYAALCEGAAASVFSAQARGTPHERAEAQWDPRLRVINFDDGENVAPGSSITVIVDAASELKPYRVNLGVSGLGGRLQKQGSGARYSFEFSIPASYTGPLTLNPSVSEYGGNFLVDESTELFVRPTQLPESIELNDHYAFLELSRPGEDENIRVYGHYPDGVERNISKAAFGTTFTSSDPSVATVEEDEYGRPLLVPGGRHGTAIVTVRNGQAEALLRVWASDKRVLGTPQDVTGRLAIERSGFGLDRETGYFVQLVTFHNTGDLPLMGSLYVLFEGLPEGVRLVNQYTETSRITPEGVPFKQLELSDGSAPGAALLPGDTAELRLEFLNRVRKPIDYDISVLQMDYRP